MDGTRGPDHVGWHAQPRRRRLPKWRMGGLGGLGGLGGGGGSRGRGAAGKTNCSQVIGRARNPRPNPGRSFLSSNERGAAASLLQQMESLQQRLRLSMMSTSQSQFRVSSFIHSFTSPAVSYSVLRTRPISDASHARTYARIHQNALTRCSQLKTCTHRRDNDCAINAIEF